jgi:hypothetical protein
MIETRAEFIALLIGAFTFAIVACAPRTFIRVLGGGRVNLSRRGLVRFRLIAAICSVGVLARLLIRG